MHVIVAVHHKTSQYQRLRDHVIFKSEKMRTYSRAALVTSERCMSALRLDLQL